MSLEKTIHLPQRRRDAEKWERQGWIMNCPTRKWGEQCARVSSPVLKLCASAPPRLTAFPKLNANIRQLIILCLALLAVHPASAEISGRLFFTPEQRAMLDNARRQNIQQATEEQAATSGGMAFNGVVQRSDGRTTVWVNSRPVSGADTANRLGSAKNGSAVLKMPYPGKAVDLKVGQRLDPVTGKAVESYQGRPKSEIVKEASKPAGISGKENTPDKRAPNPGAEPEILR